MERDCLRVRAFLGVRKIFWAYIEVLQKNFLFGFLPFLGPLPAANGGSQARDLIGTADASLCQSHSNTGYKLRLRPTPQLLAIPDPEPTE